jgi:two-component system response regulator AtoC
VEHSDETPTLEQVEWRHIDEVLKATLKNRTLAAKLLGINRSTLVRKLARREREQGSQR